MIDNENIDTPRTSEEIARRAIALHCIIAASHGVSKKEIIKWLKEERLWNDLTPREVRFISHDDNPVKEISRMTWFVEAQVTLLWAIGKLNSLPSLTAKCDTAPVVGALPGLFTLTTPFIESATLRSAVELKREEEELYDIRCQIEQAIKIGKAVPGGFDKDVAFFRHYGLSWVVGYCGQAWDEVTPDT